MNPVKLYCFCSVKGGTGKSTLSVATAHYWAQQGQKVVVLDCDLVGTSLADGLLLKAPKLPVLDRGRLDLSAGPTEYLTPAEVRRARIPRIANPAPYVPMGVPYLNDFFSSGTFPCNVEALFWRHEVESALWQNNLRYLPSSAAPADAEQVAGWLHTTLSEEPDPRWAGKLSDLLEALMTAADPPQVIVLDLPPGLFGFSRQVLTLLYYLQRRAPLPDGFPDLYRWQWKLIRHLVMTQDRNDWRMGLEHRNLLLTQEGAAPLPAVINRLTMGETALRNLVKRDFPDTGVEKSLKMVAADDQLSKIFRDHWNLSNETKANLEGLWNDQ